MNTNLVQSWLLYTTDKPMLVVGQQYRDDLTRSYQWDEKVYHHDSVNKGDVVFLWDGNELFGMSVINRIETGEGIRIRTRCPNCLKTKINERTTLNPRYRCGSCESEFNDPSVDELEVKTYKAIYEAGWTQYDGNLSKQDIQNMCLSKKSQHSLRLMDIELLKQYFAGTHLNLPFNNILNGSEKIRGGHKFVTAKTRIGQTDFRNRLFRRYGPECAISGPSPEKALHACHLYSYAEKEHHLGGILLRSDIHSLFDSGLLKIDPDKQTVNVDNSLKKYPHYWNLHGKPIKISLDKEQKRWLKLMWNI